MEEGKAKEISLKMAQLLLDEGASQKVALTAISMLFGATFMDHKSKNPNADLPTFLYGLVVSVAMVVSAIEENRKKQGAQSDAVH